MHLFEPETQSPKLLFHYFPHYTFPPYRNWRTHTVRYVIRLLVFFWMASLPALSGTWNGLFSHFFQIQATWPPLWVSFGGKWDFNLWKLIAIKVGLFFYWNQSLLFLVSALPSGQPSVISHVEGRACTPEMSVFPALICYFPTSSWLLPCIPFSQHLHIHICIFMSFVRVCVCLWEREGVPRPSISISWAMSAFHCQLHDPFSWDTEVIGRMRGWPWWEIRWQVKPFQSDHQGILWALRLLCNFVLWLLTSCSVFIILFCWKILTASTLPALVTFWLCSGL